MRLDSDGVPKRKWGERKEGNTLPAPASKLLGVEKRDREVEITASAVEGTFVVAVARRHFQVYLPEERHRAPL